MEVASATPNSRNRRPTWPDMNAIGMNTAISVIVVAMTAKAISRAPM